MACALRIGLFFDGTGNAMGGKDESNVAKLYRQYRGDAGGGGKTLKLRGRETLIFKRYITGVGTTEGFISRKTAKGSPHVP